MTAPAIAPPPPIAPPRGRRLARALGRGAMVLGGLAVGLGVAEAVFRWRDGAAFPHLNVYVADPELGVRLMPGASQDLAFGGNPRTHVRINAAGLRGAELAAPVPDEVLVVGDSQVFGLGVEEDQTFAARLAGLIGRPVVNGGVPTYGPAEYRAVIAEQLARRHPRTVVLTINLVNDLFEAERPNRDRHAVWDGWAVRKETAPATTTSFPGRDLLFRRSHLFFALRKWRHGDDRNDERGVASEGTWRDLVATGEHVRRDRAAVDQARHDRLEAVTGAHREIADAERRIDEDIQRLLGDREPVDERALATARANPGDIVESFLPVESARATIATADHIARAVAVRARLRKRLAEWARRQRSDEARQALATITASDQAFTALSALEVQQVQAMLAPPLGGYLADVQQLVERAGARLVVVILPIDVQVSADEWKKYGAPPIDMTATAALTGELVERCHALGVSALDATAALAAAEPGAFLDKDIHMTPKGHAALAAALARTLAEPAPHPAARAGRSPVPVPEVWRQAPELTVAGSSGARCETKQVREWLRVVCVGRGPTRPVDAAFTRDDTHDATALVMPREVSLLIPLVRGQDVTATLRWRYYARALRVAWAAGAERPMISLGSPDRLAPPDPSEPYESEARFRSPTERAICDCWQLVFGGARYDQDGPVFTCPGAYGAPDPGCVARYYQPGPRCPELLACTRRDPSSPP